MDLLLFVLVLGFLVLVHELGHFLAARAVGIPIEEFGIGFPPRLVTLFTWKGTRFTLNLIPFGGFVRPKQGPTPDSPDALRAAPPKHQLLVLVAGPLMNLVTALVLFLVLFGSYGRPVPRELVIWYVEPDSPAAQAGLQPGDRLLEVAHQPVTDFSTLRELVKKYAGQPIPMKVRRGQTVLTVTVVPRPDPPPGQGAMGIRLLEYGWEPVPGQERVSLAWQSFAQQIEALVTFPIRLLTARTPEERPAGKVLGFRGMYTSLQTALYIDRVLGHRPPVYALSMVASLSLSLGILNLLPIPALDGGRILVLLGEMLFRRRLPVQWEYAIMLAGFFLLMAVMVFINLREWLPQ